MKLVRYLLDTSALLAHYRQESGWEEVQALFEDSEAEIMIACPTLTEFARRLHALGADDATILETLENYSLLFTNTFSVDRTVALAAYAIGRETPQRLPLIDALIAATARVNEATLVHRDPHMATIPMAAVRQQALAMNNR
ncbi:type II toxin-antitoxin system VapC family toxin [Promineifilum sp.]|uniref:type II toxin-antitoxin system VapC family toxin n=1 Tax=Promineifilum sp. TaxID=2664178 RepID=UPI0035AE2D00